MGAEGGPFIDFTGIVLVVVFYIRYFFFRGSAYVEAGTCKMHDGMENEDTSRVHVHEAKLETEGGVYG